MAVVFEDLFCRNIVHICFGEDVSDMTFEYDVRKNGRGSKEFVRKTLRLPEAIHESDDAAVEAAPLKSFNPLYRWLRKLTGKK